MGRHCINVRIHQDTDLFNPLDPEGRCLADSVKNYIYEGILERNLGEDLEIHIISDEAVNVERVNEAVRCWCEKERESLNKDRRRNHMQELLMFIIGLAFITISLSLQDRIPIVWYTVLSTIGAFSIWEASSFWIVKNPKVGIRKKILEKLRSHTAITFEYRETE